MPTKLDIVIGQLNLFDIPERYYANTRDDMVFVKEEKRIAL